MQLAFLDANYNGGLAAYIGNAKRLLEESRTGTRHREHAEVLQDDRDFPVSSNTWYANF